MLEIAEPPPTLRLALCGDEAVAARAGTALGLHLPDQPCRAVEAAERAALWLGPGEWLVLAREADDIRPALSAALAGLPHSLVDITDGFAGLALHGPGAARALSAGCPLDLHPDAFPPGMATRTVLARAGIVLWRRGPQQWRLEAGRSHAAYIRAFLAEAARGMPAF